MWILQGGMKGESKTSNESANYFIIVGDSKEKKAIPVPKEFENKCKEILKSKPDGNPSFKDLKANETALNKYQGKLKDLLKQLEESAKKKQIEVFEPGKNLGKDTKNLAKNEFSGKDTVSKSIDLLTKKELDSLPRVNPLPRQSGSPKYTFPNI